MNIIKEVWILAQYQKGILERKFPKCQHVLYEYCLSDHWARLEVQRSTRPHHPILIASFSTSCVRINANAPLGFYDHKIDYADPKFTDDLLSDMLKRMI